MKRLLAWIAALPERVNPIAVKEFRQAVRSRLVVAILLLFLLINLVALAVLLPQAAAAAPTDAAGHSGFATLFMVLQITCVFFVPLYVGVRLSMERNDANLDLLFVTTLGPGAIIRGKYVSAMALTLLIYSACMPFLTVTYLLRGIDLPTIFFCLAGGLCVCAGMNALGIFAGCIPGSLIIRGLVALGTLYVAGLAVALSGAWAWSNVAGFWRDVGWSGILIALCVGALGIGLLYVLSVAILSPKTSNRMFAPRLYTTAAWLITGGVFLAWSFAERSAGPMCVWLVGWGLLLSVGLFVAVGERDHWTARVRRTIPQNGFGRALAFFFYSGSAGGLLWTTLLMAATLVVTAYAGLLVNASALFASTAVTEAIKTMTCLFGYPFCYCCLAAFLRTTALRNLPLQNAPVIALLIAITAGLAPYILGFLFAPDFAREPAWYLLGSPMILLMGGLWIGDVRTTILPLVSVGSLICFALALPWMLAQWRQFLPYRSAGAPRAVLEEVIEVVSVEQAGEVPPG